MRSTTIRTSFFFALVGAIAACSAAANDPVGDPPDASQDAAPAVGDHDSGVEDATTGNMDSTTKVDSGTDTGSGDTGVHDTGIVDAPFDGVIVTDAAFEPQGSPCMPNGEQQRDPMCGLCGHRDRVCLATTDGGTPTWQTWGACVNPVVGGCLPGASDILACGFCGTQPRLCDNFCNWTTGLCTGSGVCSPGDTEFSPALSCDAGLGRTTTCDVACHWGVPSTTCTAPPPPPTLIIAKTASGTATATFAFGPKITRLDTGTCPDSVLTTQTIATFVKVVNKNATHSATISVWSSLPTAGTIIDTVMTSYAASTDPPTTDADRGNCVDVNDDNCSSTLITTACKNSWAGLMQDDSSDHSVTIPANSFVWIYVAAYSPTTASGNFQLSTYTHSIN